MSFNAYASEAEVRVCGIPAIVRYTCEPVARSRDYGAEGGIEVTAICDRRGRPAPWLERKLTDADWADLIDALYREEGL